MGLINRYRNLTVLLIVIGLQLVLLAWQVKNGQDVRLIRVWTVTAVTPLARLLDALRSNTLGVARDYLTLFDVREENKRMKAELGRLKMENQFLRSELATADRARALAAFSRRTPSKTIGARIIGSGTGANSRVVFVDRGSASGVLRGMAVITPDGIVGKVQAVFPTASQVLLITDPSFAAGVVSHKNRVRGTLKGQGHSTCIVDYVQNEEKVEAGEMFFTSGDDRVFPRGLPVGVVNVVRQGKTFKEIFVVPDGVQNGLEEVLIVLEGVHQPLPDPRQAPGKMFLLNPAPAEGPPPQEYGLPNVIQTDADRVRERYRQLGEAQRHVYGEGRVPNFNLPLPKPASGTSSPAPPEQAAPAKPAQTPSGPGPSAPTRNHQPAVVSPSAPLPPAEAKPPGPAPPPQP